MLLGVLLAVVALGLRRWLASGPQGERWGFTARPLVDRDSAAVQIAGVASAALQPAHVRRVPQSARFELLGRAVRRRRCVQRVLRRPANRRCYATQPRQVRGGALPPSGSLQLN